MSSYTGKIKDWPDGLYARKNPLATGQAVFLCIYNGYRFKRYSSNEWFLSKVLTTSYKYDRIGDV